MDRKKEQETAWKSERIRAERRERLARLKDKDGGKKAIKSHSIAGRVIAIVLAVLILLGGGTWLLFRFGVPQKALTALTTSGQGVSAADLNLVMGLHAANLLQMSMIYTPENQKTLDGLVPNTERSYRDVLIESAGEEIRYIKAMTAHAESAGFALKEEDKATMEKNAASLVASFTDSAAKNKQSLSEFLENSFGPGASMAQLEKYYRESFFVNAYVFAHFEAAKPDEAELEKYYEEHKDDLDMVDYRIASFTAEYETDADDKAKEEAKQEAVKRANDMLAELDKVDKFYDLTLKYLQNADAKVKLEQDPASLEHRFELKSSQKASGDIKTWLFDAARKPGDKTVIETNDGARVVWFEKRYRADVYPYSVRHILIKVDRMTGTDEEKAAAKKKAEEILGKFNEGEQSEEIFATLAKENSEDGNAATGGLYENIEPGKMVSEFENWALDPARKAGDTGIVQTQFGYHIMYYSGHGDEAVWQANASKRVANDETVAWREAIVKEASIDYSGFGTRFAGKSNVLSALFGAPFKPQAPAEQPEPQPTAN